MVIKPQYDYVGGFSEGLSVFGSNAKYGFIDKTGNVVIKAQYGLAESFFEGLAAVNTGTILEGSWGFIDKIDKLIIPAEYQGAVTLDPMRFRNGFAQVKFKDNNWGYINKDGKVVWKKT